MSFSKARKDGISEVCCHNEFIYYPPKDLIIYIISQVSNNYLRSGFFLLKKIRGAEESTPRIL